MTIMITRYIENKNNRILTVSMDNSILRNVFALLLGLPQVARVVISVCFCVFFSSWGRGMCIFPKHFRQPHDHDTTSAITEEWIF